MAAILISVRGHEVVNGPTAFLSHICCPQSEPQLVRVLNMTGGLRPSLPKALTPQQLSLWGGGGEVGQIGLPL